MRLIKIGLVGLTLGVGLGTLAAGEAVAQGRVVVPIIVNRGALPAAQPAPSPTILEPAGHQTRIKNAASVPSPTQEIRIVTPDGRGATETRITIEGAPNVAGAAAGRGATQSFSRVPAFSRELHIRIEKDGATRGLEIFSNGSEVETPIVILPR